MVAAIGRGAHIFNTFGFFPSPAPAPAPTLVSQGKDIAVPPQPALITASDSRDAAAPLDAWPPESESESSDSETSLPCVEPPTARSMDPDTSSKSLSALHPATKILTDKSDARSPDPDPKIRDVESSDAEFFENEYAEAKASVSVAPDIEPPVAETPVTEPLGAKLGGAPNFEPFIGTPPAQRHATLCRAKHQATQGGTARIRTP